MNLLDLLSSDVISSVAKSAGTSSKDTASVLASALPDLMKSMAGNASTKEGAASLSKALDAHTSDSSVADLLKNIDTEDGAKILGHILGSKKDAVSTSVAKKTGVDNDSISTILASAAPLLLSALGSEKKSAGTSEDGLGDLIGSLLGKDDDKDNDISGTLFSLAGSLLASNEGSSKKSNSNLGSILNVVGKILK